MRFQSLQLLKYGQFDGCELAFPPGDCDLQIIFGPNEAGKSTTLEAVGDLLFGFPHVTRYAFRFDRQLLRVGAVVEDAGGVFPIRRRKGNAQTLLGADDEPIEPSALAAALGVQTRESFERMFGLDHNRLRAGGQAILDARDDVGQAIFAAGSGLVEVTQVCNALEAEAKAIWTPRAGEGRAYTGAARAFQEARARLKDVQVRPAHWLQARRALAEAEAAVTALRAERAGLEQLSRALERRRRILAPVARRQALADQLAGLGEIPELPPTAGERFETALLAADRARAEITLTEGRIATLEESLAAEQPSPEALEAQTEVETLREMKGAVDQSLSDLPKVRNRCEAHSAQALKLQAEIGWPAEASPAARGRLPGRPALAEVRDLLERRSGIDQQHQTARLGLEEAAAGLQTLTARLAILPPPSNLLPLQTCVRTLRDAGDPEAALRGAEKICQEMTGLLAARMAALTPWQCDLAALRALTLPAEEDVDAVFDQIADAAEQAGAERAARDREAERLEQVQLDRRQALQAHPTPGLQDLDAARGHRQAAWAPLKAQLLGGQRTDDPDAAAQAYEGLVDAADQTADARFSGAEHAGRLAALDSEIEKSELRLNQAEARLVKANDAHDQASAEFARLVSPLGFALSPAAFGAWRDSRISALEAGRGLDAAAKDLAAAQAVEAAARQTLIAAFGEDSAVDAGLSLRLLLADADRRLEAAAAAAAQHATLRAQVETAEAAEQKAQIQSRSATQADEAWSALWGPALQRLGLPAEAGVASVRSRLELMDTLRTELDEALSLTPRIEEMGAFVGQFESRVSSVAARVGQPALADASTTLSALIVTTTKASAQAQRAKDLSELQETAREERAAGARRLAEAEAEMKPLLALAPAGDPLAFRDLVARAADAVRLRAELSRLEAEIVGHGEGRALQDLVDDAAGADGDLMAADAEGLAERIAALNTAIEARIETRLAAEADFKAVDDRPDAAIAAFEMAEARTEMGFQAELYLRKRAELTLLRAAVERYRREKQAPLLGRASELFRTLTLGRYTRLMVEYDGDAAKLAGQKDDGATVVPVEGMSQGTVDQLFLALRIAAVEDTVAQGSRLPFLADDLFINYDDARAAAGFKVLAELSRRTQVLFFTHHDHLLEVAKTALKPIQVATCALPQT
jgi:uncharacterized protein YhaN